MPDASTLGLFTVTALALLLIPGPAVLYIVTRSVEQGRRAGVVSALGVATGALVHVAAAALGLSVVLVHSAVAFTSVKLAGAAYLLVIGVRRLLGRGVVMRPSAPRASLRRVYWEGALVNALNPKVALFFVAFLPQFVQPDHGLAAGQMVVLGLLFVVLGLCSDSAYAIAAGTAGPWLFRRRSLMRLRDRVSGVVYVALGVAAAMTGRSARAGT